MKLLDALEGKNTGRPPVWLMRQAGRYMPKYQALRKKHALLDLFRNPEMIHDVTMMPIEQLGVDAAILFSDILTLLDLFNVEWDVKPGVGPVIPPNQKLERRETLPFLTEGIQMLRKSLTVPLIGFCGAPFTIASYLIEGAPSKTLSKTRRMMYKEPEAFHKLLSTLTDGAIDLLRIQIDAGVQAIQIFDSWAGWLGPTQFENYSLKYMQRIAQSVDVPVISYCQKITPKLGALSLDWRCNIQEVRKTISAPLQGNLDPSLLYADAKTIEKSAQNLLESMRGDPAYIFNLGHGLLPDTPYDNVRTLVDTVKAWTP